MGIVRDMGRYGTGSVFQRQKDGMWVGRLEVGWNASGRRRRVEVYAKSEAECRRRLVKRRRELESQGVPDENSTAGTTVKTWADKWLEIRGQELSPNTFRNYTSVVNRWIVPNIGRKRLDRLTPADLRMITKTQEDAGVKPSSTVFTRRVLVKLLRDAAVEGHTVPDRLFHVRAPIKNAADRDAIPIDDATAIIRAALTMPDASRWIVAFLQGLRQGEALGLTWDHVDLDAGRMDIEWQLDNLPYLDRAEGTFRKRPGEPVIQVWRSFHLVPVKTKSGRRVIPIIDEVGEALHAWRQVAPVSPHGLVWPRVGGLPRSSDGDTDAWLALQDMAQVAHFDGREGRRYHGHEIRHTTATLLLEAGVDPKTVEAIMGHSSILTSRGYQHVSQQLSRDALTKVAGRLMPLRELES